MTIRVRFPVPSGSDVVTVDRLLDEVGGEPTDGRLAVGDERIRDFLVAFSHRLMRPDLARRHPELGSLGFFLRRGELARAVGRLGDGEGGSRRAPRGLVLHFPPANVDTIFVYSWALSALAGNINIVRVSERATSATQAVLKAMDDVLSEAHPAIAETQRMVSYERDDAITGALSAACDVRVLWGGDQSVTDLRRFPVRPLTRDLAFPDRSSFAAISVPGWQSASLAKRAAAVDGFANDLFWFDQAACSSPRGLFWVGDTTNGKRARTEFSTLLAEVVDRHGWHVDPAMAVEKYVSTYGLAATGAATVVAFDGNAIANVDLAGLGDLQRHWLGAGTICHVAVGSLSELTPAIQRKDQTFSQFGFSSTELQDFVTMLAGRGIDRIVPFGQALTFASVWDGFDLLHEFTRIITIQA